MKTQEESMKIIDSVPLTNGKFSFEGQVEEPMRYIIQVDTSSGRIPLLLSNEPVKVQAHIDSLYSATVHGGADHEVYRSYYDNEFEDIRVLAGSVYQLSDSLTQGGKTVLSEEQDDLMEAKWKEINDFAYEKTSSFIDENSKSIASAIVIED